MEAANSLPVPTEDKSPSVEQLQKIAVAEALASGKHHTEIARAIGGGDKKKEHRWRVKIRRWCYMDPEFQELAGLTSRGEMVMNLGRATQGLIRRAAKGYPPAVKLLFEATGFHNPSVQHEHSGEIKVKLDMPRPTAVEDHVDGEAEVVDD